MTEYFVYRHFKKYASIFLEFLPQILLLCFLFLWMVVMIFIKWIKYAATYDGVGKLPQTLNCTELIVEKLQILSSDLNAPLPC